MRILRPAIHALTLVAITSLGAAWPPGGVRYATQGYGNLPNGAASDGSGGAIFVWTRWVDSNFSHTELRAQRLDDHGTPMWGGGDEGVVVCDAPGTRYDAKLMEDGAGGIFVAWFDQRSWGQIYATRIESDGSIAPGWPVNGKQIAPTGGFQVDLDMTTDGAGGFYVIWSDWRNYSAGSSADIYAQRLTDSGVQASSWPSEGVPVCTAHSVQDQTSVISDGSGGLIACWRDARGESTGSYLEAGDIYAQRITSDGSAALSWPDGGLPVGAAALAQNLPAIVTDGAGGAIISWRDYREDSVTSHVYAARVSAGGARLWSPSGIRAEPSLTREWIPTMVADGSGGAYIVRGGSRPGSTSSVFLTRLSSSGYPVWSPGGIAVSKYGGEDRPILAPNPLGGVFVAWSQSDPSRTISTVRLTRFTSTGKVAPAWPDSGVVVSAGTEWRSVDPVWPGSHGGPILADGSGGVIASWITGDGPGSTASATRLNNVGHSNSLPEGPRATMGAVSPNPGRGAIEVTVRFPADGEVILAVYDLHGRRCHQIATEGSPGEARALSLDLSGLPSGIYFVRLSDRHGMGIASRKIVIVR